ncbi:hypothetical protein [Paenibacillus xylanexedens]|nr:hypothetical protein [Paenibacillus xylanexedens]
MKVTLRFVLPSDAEHVQQYASYPEISETSNFPILIQTEQVNHGQKW